MAVTVRRCVCILSGLAVLLPYGCAESSPSEATLRSRDDRGETHVTTRAGDSSYEEQSAETIERLLQTSSMMASTRDPTIDEVHSSVFSRPPLSSGETSMLVYYTLAGVYAFCLVLMLVSVNLDQAEQRKRMARALVPQESVPCAIAEQYYLDDRLIAMRSPKDYAERRQRMNFCMFLVRYAASFGEVLARQHLFLSFFVMAIPTFTRVKRGLLIILQLHLCILTSAVAFNVLEHDTPQGRYEAMSCGSNTDDCTATLPLAFISAAIMCPFFRYAAYHQFRLTCFGDQSHPSSSPFPLNVRKFAYIKPKSLWESCLCMRNNYERHQVEALHSRTKMQQFVYALWREVQPSIKDLRYYSTAASCLYLIVVLTIIGCTCAYVLFFTAYLQDDIVYHWLAWALVMYVSSTLLFEPLLILWTEVVWCAIMSEVAQHYELGLSSLAVTSKYKEIIKEVDMHFVEELRRVGSTRIQRWWLAVLDMYKAIHEQTAAAIKIQAIRKKMIHQKKYVKERKWCMRVDILGCSDLNEVSLDELMSPFARLQCDVGNPIVMTTKVAWQSGNEANFGETFWVDVKESSAMYVSVWTKGLNEEYFIGRAYFEFQQLKHNDKTNVEGHSLKLPLFDIQHGEKATRDSSSEVLGRVHVQVAFLDPLKDKCGDSNGDEAAWMLPKHRMQFALSKMGGKVRVGKMLGSAYGRQPTSDTGAEESSPPSRDGFPPGVVAAAPPSAMTAASPALVQAHGDAASRPARTENPHEARPAGLEAASLKSANPKDAGVAGPPSFPPRGGPPGGPPLDNAPKGPPAAPPNAPSRGPPSRPPGQGPPAGPPPAGAAVPKASAGVSLTPAVAQPSNAPGRSVPGAVPGAVCDDEDGV